MSRWVYNLLMTGSLLWFGTGVAFSASPSFDCSKATKADEIAICANDQLATNDQLTTKAFNQAKFKNRKAALATARSFLKIRGSCGANSDCIADAQTRAVLDFGLLGAQLPKSEPVPAKINSTLSEIRTNCAAEWQADYSMQEYCVNKQVEALQAIPEMDRATPVEREILGICASEWRKRVGFDYAMIKYCFDKQLSAYRRLN